MFKGKLWWEGDVGWITTVCGEVLRLWKNGKPLMMWEYFELVRLQFRRKIELGEWDVVVRGIRIDDQLHVMGVE